MTVDTLDCDFLVLGSGAAGLYAAWQAAAQARVIVVTDGALASGSSYWAQGGIAAVTTDDDTLEAHVADTLAAGRGLCDRAAVELLVAEGAAAVRDLIAAGMVFDTDADGRLRRGLEGGHSYRRILHALGVQTGRALVDFLIERVRGLPSVHVIEHGFAHALLRDENGRCAGARVFAHERAEDMTIRAAATVLATGGYSALYRRTTNPPGALGLGLGLARDIGARCIDLEFVQFHPTAFYEPAGRTFLISEALRGAGATLVNEAGARFLADAPGAELAPRDAVAAAITAEIARQRCPWVGLDLRHLDPAMLRQSFGFIMDAIAERGIDVAREPVPVAPAAHYCIGGVATDRDGVTDVAGLYAAGEVAATGVHGANRLASNSLLECLVFARRAVTHAFDQGLARPGPIASGPPMTIDPAGAASFAGRRRELGALMTRHVGIERDRAGLESALAAIEAARSTTPVVGSSAEYFAFRDRHIHDLAQTIARAALAREASVGVHRRRDSSAGGDEPDRRGLSLSAAVMS
ncbi:L-aspartate oxidase [Salinisphaera sp.]|uniref:L-aspartate oxidase n=1 Tax=Salinisphaera sp. TaxID=1914330 RepID=UPI002D771B88|nr:L-aspartate oxidase [Salinisphaera sp.]HET7313686.1 L-aspartate oxidase [Salinisphaera sp.]